MPHVIEALRLPKDPATEDGTDVDKDKDQRYAAFLHLYHQELSIAHDQSAHIV